MTLHDYNPYQGPWRAVGHLLLPLSVLYAAGGRARRMAYQRGWRRSHSAGVPVICVGNISSGGTGKTPMVQLLAGWLRDAGLRPAVLSRGFGGAKTDRIKVLEAHSPADPAEAGDEPCLLARSLPGVPVLVHPDRVASARLAVDDLKSEVLLLDDGYQHHRLQRDLDILLVGASEPFWRNRVIPSGSLREPFSAMGRADVVVTTRTPENGIPAPLDRLIKRHCPTAPLFTAQHHPTGVTPLGPQPLPRPVEDLGFLLVSGIGNPQSFHQTAETCGLRVVGELRFADHHPFQPPDLAAARRRMAELGGDALLFTEKDAIRLHRLADHLGCPAGFLGVRMVVAGEQEFRDLVLQRSGVRGDGRT